jgi:hypothetical protein
VLTHSHTHTDTHTHTRMQIKAAARLFQDKYFNLLFSAKTKLMLKHFQRCSPVCFKTSRNDFFSYLHHTTNVECLWSNLCTTITHGTPETVAVVDRWQLLRGHLFNKCSSWDLLQVIDKWSPLVRV